MADSRDYERAGDAASSGTVVDEAAVKPEETTRHRIRNFEVVNGWLHDNHFPNPLFDSYASQSYQRPCWS